MPRRRRSRPDFGRHFAAQLRREPEPGADGRALAHHASRPRRSISRIRHRTRIAAMKPRTTLTGSSGGRRRRQPRRRQRHCAGARRRRRHRVRRRPNLGRMAPRRPMARLARRQTADEVTARGGRGIAVPSRLHRRRPGGGSSSRASRRSRSASTCSPTPSGARPTPGSSMEEWMASWSKPFWEQPTATWQHMMDAGPYAYFLDERACRSQRWPAKARGLIVGVTDGYVEPSPGTAGR